MMAIVSMMALQMVSADVVQPVSFGAAADRINMLKPAAISFSGPTATAVTATQHVPANFIADWNPSDPSQVTYGDTGGDLVTFGAAVAAPDGTETAINMVEALDDVPPAFADKPASWDLTGFSSKWSDFWSAATVVVPAWEGTGTPHYYTAGGALGPALTAVGTPSWGTSDHGAALRMSSGNHDWRIEPVGGVDLMPTSQATILMVRKTDVAPGQLEAAFGVLATGAGSAAVMSWFGNWSAPFGDGGAFMDGAPGTTTIEFIAVTFGANGAHGYYRLGDSVVQGISLTQGSNSPQGRTAGNYQIGLATGYNTTTHVGTDVMFFAALNAEWTAEQCKIWMNDPYAPIRVDGGGDRVSHPGKPSPHEVYAAAFHEAAQPLRHRFVVFAKASQRSRFRMEVSNGTHPEVTARTIGVRATFDVSSGQMVSAPTAYGSYQGTGWLAGSGSIQSVNSGWYKCSMDVTVRGGGAWNLPAMCALSIVNASDQIVYPGDGVSGIQFWQARMLPPGAFDYITRRAFFDDFDDYSTIDVNNTLQPGYNWYVANYAPAWWFEGNSAPSTPQSEYYTVANSILTIIKDGTLGANRTLNSASWTESGWVGNTFKLPAMFETRAYWDSPVVASNGCPAFWTGPIEGLEFPALHSNTTVDSLGWPGYDNPNWTIHTNAATPAGQRVLTFDYVPTFFRLVGANIYSPTGGIATPTRIVSATTTTITLDADVIAPGIAQGQAIHTVWYVEHDFIEVRNNTNPAGPHNAYETNIGMPGYTNQVFDRLLPTHPTGYNQPHDYQTLWLPYSDTDNGVWMSFIDGVLTTNGVRQYGLTFNNASYVYADRMTYPLWLGGGGRDGNFPGKFERVAVYDASHERSSAGVFNSSGQMVRTLWSDVVNHADVANPAAVWDGTLDDGTVAPTGTYNVKILRHAVEYTWEGVIGNTSPDHSTMTYHNEACVISDMEITAAGEMYYSSSYNERWPVVHVTTTADPQVTQYAAPYSFRQTYSAVVALCSDGTNAYFATMPNGVPTRSFVWATACSNKAMVTFANGESLDGIYSAIAKLDTATDWEGFIAAIAVQKTGNTLFICRPTLNQLRTYHKTSGALLQTNTTFVSPGAMQTSPTTGDLWLAHSTNGGASRNVVSKLTVDGSGNVSASGVAVSGLQGAMAVAISPDGATVLIADGGSSQQVKAFNATDGTAKTAWGSSGTLGTAGGYAASPAVTNTKFMFRIITGFGGKGAYLAYAPDGSFWLGDAGNCRSLHFSSGNAPAYVEQIAFMPAFYSCRLAHNNDARLFADMLEWIIDYGKPLAAGNGSWTLVNNWTYGVDLEGTYTSPFQRPKFVGEFSNGRTYCGLSKTAGLNIFEMTASGMRDTGAVVHASTYIDRDFNLWYTEQILPGNVCHIRKNVFTGFDGSHNPTWTADPTALPATTVVTSQTLPTGFPSTGNFDSSGLNLVETTGNGTIPIYNPDSGTTPGDRNDHLGGIDAVTGVVKFQTHPVNPVNYGGTSLNLLLYPQAPYFPVGTGVGMFGGGPILYRPGARDFFTCYRGESWGQNQTNIWSHWHESGLLISRFGAAAPYYAAQSLLNPDAFGDDIPSSYYSFKGMAGLAGNSAWGSVALVNGVYYLYQNDEWYHGGVHRWRVENEQSILLTASVVNWNSANYSAPAADPADLLEGLPFDQTNLPDNTAGWHRSPATDDASSPADPFAGPWWKVYTSSINCDSRVSPDLVIEPKLVSQTATVYKAMTRAGSGDWQLRMTSLSIASPDAIYIDILDGTNKRILRMYHGNNLSTSSFYVNGTAIVAPMPSTKWAAYIGALRDLSVMANVANGQMTVTYGDYAIIKGVDEVGADITAPARFQITYVGPETTYFFILPAISITALRFT